MKILCYDISVYMASLIRMRILRLVLKLTGHETTRAEVEISRLVTEL